jgi:hypothetical protein
MEGSGGRDPNRPAMESLSIPILINYTLLQIYYDHRYRAKIFCYCQTGDCIDRQYTSPLIGTIHQKSENPKSLGVYIA